MPFPSEASELVLRLKVLAGDESPEVLGDCFSSLLYLAPERSFDFVVGFLASGNPDIVQAASIALAQSQRRERAVPIFVDRFRGSIGTEHKEILLASIALARVPSAVDFLLKVIADEHADLAAAAIRAMAVASFAQPVALDVLQRDVLSPVADRPALDRQVVGYRERALVRLVRVGNNPDLDLPLVRRHEDEPHVAVVAKRLAGPDRGDDGPGIRMDRPVGDVLAPRVVGREDLERPEDRVRLRGVEKYRLRQPDSG